MDYLRFGQDRARQYNYWPYRGLRCRPIEVKYFLKLSADKVLVFKWSQAQVYLKFIWNMLCLCAAQLKFWFQTDLGRENSASYYRQGRQLLLTLLTTVTRWSRSTSNFYALTGKNFTGEFMRHLESFLLCLLWQLKLTESWVNLWCC